MAQELISLGVLFFCALLGGLLASKFKQPAVFGLLLVGAVIGPNSLNLVQDEKMINMMAEFGAILILFLIGLEFDITKLIKIGARSVLIGLLKVSVVLFFGFQATLLMGFDVKTALFAGVILSFSSTVVVVKILEQKAMFARKEVPLLIAILIIEDLLAVLALTFFSGLENQKAGLMETFEHIIIAILVLVLAYYIVIRAIKYFTRFIGKDSSEESVITFLALGIGALFSWFAAYLGLTPTAGAFLAGSIIASLPNAKDYGKAIHPYVMIFTSIFFISMGTLVNFSSIGHNIVLILVLLATVFIADFIAVGFSTMIFANFRNEQPFFASMALFAVGEFSLLVAKEAKMFGVALDLVSITASLIFLSAVLMTVGINYTHSIQKIKGAFSVSRKIKMERISDYMRRFFDQMEIENFFTNKLRKESKMAGIMTVALFLAFLGVRRAGEYARNFGTVFEYGFYFIALLGLLLLAKLCYSRLNEVHKTLAVILTNVDHSRNLAKCTMIVNSLALALGFIFAATLFPFAAFVLNTGGWINLIPFALLAVGGYFIRRTGMLIEGNSISFTASARPALIFGKM